MYKAIFMYKTINKTSPNYLHINRGEYVKDKHQITQGQPQMETCSYLNSLLRGQRSSCLECLSVDAREYSLEKSKKDVAFFLLWCF